MFLDVLMRRNPELIRAAIELHQSAALPANTYVLDLDAIGENAAALATEAGRLGLTAFAMTKQIGRNPDACRAIARAGIDAAVAVDMQCARTTSAAGMRLGHVGHLVQVPRAEAATAAALAPDNWTVFSHDKAVEAAAASVAAGRDQALLARIHAGGDEFYRGHEGGFPAADLAAVADRLDSLAGAHFAGVTTFPALLFDATVGTVRATANLRTIEAAARRLRDAGRDDVRVNGPGTTSAATLSTLAGAGVTQVEPGHALTGTTPWHAVAELVERPAVCYLSEISHRYADRGYFFGGGLYVDPVFPPYQIRAVVGGSADSTRLLDATLPPPQTIDYYGELDLSSAAPAGTGDSVVLGFRIQAFVTRAYTAAVSGISTGRHRVEGVWSSDGSPVAWP